MQILHTGKFIVPTKFKKLPFEKIKNKILGKKYELSIVFIDKKRSRFLNKTYRKKDEPTDILSFPLFKNYGEIFICSEIAKKKSKEFYPTSSKVSEHFANYLLFLVIHGNLHLKGFEHGDRMDKYEHSYYSWYRRRYL